MLACCVVSVVATIPGLPLPALACSACSPQSLPAQAQHPTSPLSHRFHSFQDYFKPKHIIIRLRDEEKWGPAQREALYKVRRRMVFLPVYEHRGRCLSTEAGVPAQWDQLPSLLPAAAFRCGWLHVPARLKRQASAPPLSFKAGLPGAPIAPLLLHRAWSGCEGSCADALTYSLPLHRCLQGLERFGVGKWREMIQAFPELARYKDTDVSSSRCRLGMLLLLLPRHAAAAGMRLTPPKRPRQDRRRWECCWHGIVFNRGATCAAAPLGPLLAYNLQPALALAADSGACGAAAGHTVAGAARGLEG